MNEMKGTTKQASDDYLKKRLVLEAIDQLWKKNESDKVVEGC